MKRIISVLVSVLLLVSAAAVYTIAETSGDYTYQFITEDTIEITKYQGVDEELNIPSEIDGYSVVSIGNSAFYNNLNLVKVTIPDGVVRIGGNAFSYCRYIKTVDIPSTVEEIGYYAFGDCSDITSIDIPSSVKTIGEQAFAYCTDAQTVNIPEGVETIGSRAFIGCDWLQIVEIPRSVTSIGERAFGYYLTLDQTGIVEAKVENLRIHGYAETAAQEYAQTHDFPFFDIETMETPEFEYIVSREGNAAITGYNGTAEKLEIPTELDGFPVVEIGVDAFRGCTTLKEVFIPDCAKTVSHWAFADCTSLKSVRLPDEMYAVYSNVFANCTALESIYIPDGVVASGAFLNCTSLKNVELGFRVEAVDEGAFENCKSLKSFTIVGDYVFLDNADFGYYYDNGQLKKIENFTIYGYARSTAQQYAQKHGFAFVDLGAKEEEPTQPTTPPTTVTKTKKPYKVKGLKAVSKKKKQVKVSWEKAKNAKKYVVKYSYKKNMKKAKIVTVKKLKATLKKLKSGKRVYIRVRGINGKTYGKWSAKKTVKVK